MTELTFLTLRDDIRTDSADQVWGKVSETNGLVLVDGNSGPRVFGAPHWQRMAPFSADPELYPIATGRLTRAQLRSELGLTPSRDAPPYCPAHDSYEPCEHNTSALITGL